MTMAPNQRPSTSWPGYAPWAETVASCRKEFMAVARSFGLIPGILPPVARDDVGLLHAFCRRLDDAIDDEPDLETARATLRRWRDELHGHAERRPLIAAFVAGAKRAHLPLECADDLLEGMRSDLDLVRMADDEELLRYAYRVSSAVGLMLAPLLGVEGRAAEERIVDLGMALQLSNIVLGVADDAARGRVYLPATRLRAAGLDADDVLAAPASPRLQPVLRGLADLADRLYRSAEQGAIWVPLRYRHGVILLGRAYGALGRRAAEGRSAPAFPQALPLRTRLRLLTGLLPIAARPEVLGLRPPAPHDASLHRGLDPRWRGVHR